MEKVRAGGVAYKCTNGEQVTITFTANDTDLRVTYRFEDEDTSNIVQGNSLTFTIEKPLRILRVFFHFINEAGTGGSYDVILSGSAGGEFPDPPPVLQAAHFVPFR